MPGPEKSGFDPTEEEGTIDSHKEQLEVLGKYRENATELQRNIAEYNSATFEMMLLTLLRRSDDNPELLETVKYLLDDLYHQANYGDPSKKISSKSQEKLTHGIKEACFTLNQEAHAKPLDREKFDYDFDTKLQDRLKKIETE